MPRTPVRYRLQRFAGCAAVALTLQAVAFTAPPDAFAQQVERTRSTLLASGKAMFDDQRYEESIQTLSAALLRPDTSKHERIETYRYLAYNYLTLSQLDEAEAAVRGLFVLDPSFALADTESPRFRTFFEETRQRWEAEGRPGLAQHAAPVAPVAIRHSSPSEQEQGKELRVTGQLQDPANRVKAVWLRFRAGSKGKFQASKATMTNGRFRVTIPPAAIRPPLVEYYLEAQDDAGLPIAMRGDAAAPLRVAVPAPDQGGSVFASPWFWTGTAAVIGGGVAAFFLLRDNSSSASGPPSTPSSTTPTSRVIVTVGP